MCEEFSPRLEKVVQTTLPSGTPLLRLGPMWEEESMEDISAYLPLLLMDGRYMLEELSPWLVG